jgi:hypothetical protein
MLCELKLVIRNLFAQSDFVFKRKPEVVDHQEVAVEGVALHQSGIGVDYLPAYLLFMVKLV